jgi:hypothetical protein
MVPRRWPNGAGSRPMDALTTEQAARALAPPGCAMGRIRNQAARRFPGTVLHASVTPKAPRRRPAAARRGTRNEVGR